MLLPTYILGHKHLLSCISLSLLRPIWLSIFTMAHYDRDARDVDSRSPSQGARHRFYQETNHVPHNDLRDSASFSSSNSRESESVYSDERFIFNAIRVPTPTDDSAPQACVALEEGLATNMAMFISPGSSTESSPHRGRHRQRGNWRNQAFSEQGIPRLHHLGSSPLNETVSADGDTPPHRKALSLDAHDREGLAPRWPGNVGPAIAPAQPPYPPPQRMPTPPGLPSFNTAAALHYSAQFLAPGNGARSSSSSPTRDVYAGSPRAISYSEALRRFFGVTPSLERESPTPAGIGRAEDGTIVQGRFPYRQSGHGTSLIRQLEDHPFHRSNLPVAEAEGESTGDESTERLAAKEPVSRPKRHARLYSPPTIGRLWPSSSSRLPSSREPSPTAHLWRPLASSSIFRSSRNPSPHDRRSRTPPVSPSAGQMGSSVQETGPVEGPDGSIRTPSRLQSTLAQDIDGETAIEEVRTRRFSYRDALFWLPIQIYICCCLGSLDPLDDAEDQEPLDIVSSRDTYVTARSRPSTTRDPVDQVDHANEDYQHGTQPGMQSWISSVYYSICSRAPDPAQSF